MPETVDPKTTAYAAFLNDPTFPSDGTIPDQWKQFQPRVGVAWDVKGERQDRWCARARGIYYARQNMLSQVGSVTTNGLQQQTIFRNTGVHRVRRHADVAEPADAERRCRRASSRSSPACACSTATTRTRASTTFNVGLRAGARAGLGRATSTSPTPKGSDLTRFLNYNGTARRGGHAAGNCDITPTRGQSLRAAARRRVGDQQPRRRRATAGATFGVRKRFSNGYQLEANYVLSKDEDDDSNERDPFTDRSFNFFDLSTRTTARRTATSATSSTSSRYAESAGRVPGQRPGPGALGAADHAVAARR